MRFCASHLLDYSELPDLGVFKIRRGLAAASITTTVRELHPRSHHMGATSKQNASVGKAGFELAFDGI